MDIEAFRVMDARRKKVGGVRRNVAKRMFDRAAAIAKLKGLVLLRRSHVHYQLTNGEWLINVYPGKCRILADRNRAKGPYLNVKPNWTLLDVVNAAPEKKQLAT